MFAYRLAQRLIPPALPPATLVIAGVAGALAAFAALLLPGAWFETAVVTSGVSAFVPAAEPPLGTTARLCVALFVGGGVALLIWAGLTLLPGVVRLRDLNAARRPVVRRADAHPDAPPREPLRAVRDLGFEAEEAVATVPETADGDAADEIDLPPEPVIAMGAPTPAIAPEPVPVTLAPASVIAAPPPPVQPLPADLDQPLSAFDPAAVLETPLPPPRPVSPLPRANAVPVYEAGERFETFELVPPPAPISAPETVATVHSLLDRLERGIARRTRPASDPRPPAAPEPTTGGLESTLDALRRMATQG